MNDKDLRDRWKAMGKDRHKADDIFSVWDDQKRMQAEDRQLETELEQAKRRAKELKRTLRTHQLGEARISVDKIRDKVTGNKLVIPVKNQIKRLTKRQRAVTISIVVLVCITALSAIVILGNQNESSTGTLGENDSSITVPEAELPRETPTTFELLYPTGKNSESYEVVRISPPGVEPSYVFIDNFGTGSDINNFQVTQQKVPDSFNLEKTATDFQASNIIKVDDTTVYHGYSEKGRVQSLIFIKNGNLISIRSPRQFSDDQWAAYIVSLR